jgi:DNA-binding transcriptional ArsR family regulator
MTATPTATIALRSPDAAVFAALGEPSRLRIVELLRGGPRSVGEIADALGIRQPQVSKHLRVLDDTGIVAVRPLAKRRIYRLEAEAFETIAEWVDSFERLWDARLDALGELLDSMTDDRTDDRTDRTDDRTDRTDEEPRHGQDER